MARHVPVVRLSSKGQIVIPATLRRKLGLRTGQALAVRAGNGREVVFVPLEEQAADIHDMLRRAREWTTTTGRDLVEELHRRRQAERERERVARERGRD
jgi:AbrB family looped-hinge helix DNA binding protein